MNTVNTEDRRGKLERNNSPQSVACCYPSRRPRAVFDGKSARPTNKSDSSNSSVRFSQSVIVCFTRSRLDYTPQQIKDCFYQCDELYDIKKQCFDELRRRIFAQDQDDDDEEEDEEAVYCLRGLEIFHASSQREKFNLRAEAALKVFDAEDDGCDEITISREYSSVTAPSQMWANMMGLRDQRDAFSIYEQSVKQR